MWIIYGLLAATIAALMTIVSKVGLKQVDPTLATAVRSVVMCVFMLGVTGATRNVSSLAQIDLKNLSVIVIAGIFGALSWLCYFLGLRETSASQLASLDRLSLPLIIIFSTVLLGETLTPRLALGGLLVTAGALIIAWK
jgi:transporter family protein